MTLLANNTGILSWKEKIGYACGDVASNFYWRIFDVFLFIFYDSSKSRKKFAFSLVLSAIAELSMNQDVKEIVFAFLSCYWAF